MNREEQIGMINVHKEAGIRVNTPVFNAFSKKLVGWVHPQDALVNLGETKDFEHNQWLSDEPWKEDELGVNSNNFRCDEFTKNHTGEHILFSGCSVTYGVGLYTKELWSYKLYEKIKAEKLVSGYFNLGTPGTSTMDICANIIKYISLYGKPDTIFLDLPDLQRFYWIPKEDYIINAMNNLKPEIIDNKLTEWIRHGTHAGRPTPEVEVNKIHTYNYLLWLEQFCLEAGIKLYIFSYVMETIRFLKTTDLTRIMDFDNDKIVDELFEYSQNNKTDKFFLVARDARHHGTAFHEVWANKLFESYKEGK